MSISPTCVRECVLDVSKCVCGPVGVIVWEVLHPPVSTLELNIHLSSQFIKHSTCLALL